jgi:Rod binding domain-containing protein
MDNYSAITPVILPQPSCMDNVKNLNNQKVANNDLYTLKNLSRDFEAVLINFTIKTMWETIPKSGLLEEDNSGMDIYTDIMQSTLAQDISSKGGIGIADTIYQQLVANKGSSVNDHSASHVRATMDGCPYKGVHTAGDYDEKSAIK